MACLNFIRSKSFPKNGQSRALFPTTHTSQLPSANTVHTYLRSSGLTETELELEHVVSLLDILVYDEQIEKIPVLPFAFGGGARTNGLDDDDDFTDSGTSSGGSGSDSDSGKRVGQRIGSAGDGSDSDAPRKKGQEGAQGHDESAATTRTTRLSRAASASARRASRLRARRASRPPNAVASPRTRSRALGRGLDPARVLDRALMQLLTRPTQAAPNPTHPARRLHLGASTQQQEAQRQVGRALGRWG